MYEEWVAREDVATETIWDGGATDWDIAVISFAISPSTLWDATPGGELWTPRRAYPET